MSGLAAKSQGCSARTGCSASMQLGAEAVCDSPEDLEWLADKAFALAVECLTAFAAASDSKTELDWKCAGNSTTAYSLPGQKNCSVVGAWIRMPVMIA